MTTSASIIAPSILAGDFAKLSEEISSIEKAGADWLHIDVMDGSFVPPITFGANMVSCAKRFCSLELDVHLMIVNPERHIEEFQRAGANRLTVHQETCPHLHRVLAAIKDAGMRCGVSINPGTPVESIFDVLHLADLVLVMTVNPGWGGQQFIPHSVQKIAALSKEISQQKLSTAIQVDGGINVETARQCCAVGASIFVAGTYVFASKDRAAAIKSLR